MRGRARDGERRPAPPAAASGLERQLTRWLIGLRLLAVTALLIGALLVQTTTDELLPIGSLTRVTGATYLLSLIWIALELLGVPARTCGAAQLTGDLLLISAIVYFTGGVWSPFPFLYLVTVGLAALIFGLRGALLAAGGAFALYGALVVAILYRLVSPPLPQLYRSLPSSSSLAFQLFVTAVGFTVVALLTSYLAHSAHRAEANLVREKRAKERLLALSADIVHSVDSGVIATDPRGTIILANPAAHRITADPAGLEGRPIQQALPVQGVNWNEIISSVERSAQTPRRLEGSLADQERPLGLSISPLAGEDGSLVGMVVHFRDLTQVREEERQEHLRQRMAAVGEVAASIAHEIRNPLASISGAAQVLARLPALGESERRLLRIIVEESRRLSAIIESFLGYA
ncbi:MAG: PAS domain-containing protein, partial [Acidobacteriota bacterium]